MQVYDFSGIYTSDMDAFYGSVCTEITNFVHVHTMHQMIVANTFMEEELQAQLCTIPTTMIIHILQINEVKESLSGILSDASNNLGKCSIYSLTINLSQQAGVTHKAQACTANNIQLQITNTNVKNTYKQ